MKLEITIRVKIEKPEDLQKRIDLLFTHLIPDLWDIFGNVMRVNNEPPVTVAWSDIDETENQ